MHLIDANALELDAEYNDSEYWAYSITQIQNAPTIEERKKGKWIYNPKDAIEMMFTLPKCSIFGHESSDALNFYTNCGADMREGAKENEID